jgi:hypothetical protein
MDASGIVAIGVTSITAFVVMGVTMWQQLRPHPTVNTDMKALATASVIDIRHPQPDTSRYFTYEAVTLANDKKVYMVTEALSTEWVELVARLCNSCDTHRQYGLALRKVQGGSGSSSVDSSWDEFLKLSKELHINDIRLLLGIPAGLAGLQMVTQNQKPEVSWTGSRYITYVLDSEPTGIFRHVASPPQASDGNSVMQFFAHYKPMLMIMASVDVENTPFFFNRGITRLPAHVLEGNRNQYPDLSMLLHAYSASTAVKRNASKEWLMVSPIDSMSKILAKTMASGIDYFESENIPTHLQAMVKTIRLSYHAGAEDVDTIIRISSLLRRRGA